MPDGWSDKRIVRPESADLALAIDQQLYPALLPFVQRYAGEHRIKVALQEGTCGVASGALAEKSADITGMCCPPGPLDRLPGVVYHTVGIAAMAVIVNPANSIEDVSLDQARQLFGGKTRRWSEMPVSGVRGSGDDTVRAVTRLHCKLRPGHWHLLLDNEDLYSRSAVEVAAIRDMISEVAKIRNAIGYETLWHVADNVTVGKVKALRLGGVDPRDGSAVAAGRYPLYRVLNITTWQGPDADPKAADLVDYLVKTAAQIDPVYSIVPASALRQNHWRFAGDELIGEPAK